MALRASLSKPDNNIYRLAVLFLRAPPFAGNQEYAVIWYRSLSSGANDLDVFDQTKKGSLRLPLLGRLYEFNGRLTVWLGAGDGELSPSQLRDSAGVGARVCVAPVFVGG